jgi:hypothetical protein
MVIQLLYRLERLLDNPVKGQLIRDQLDKRVDKRGQLSKLNQLNKRDLLDLELIGIEGTLSEVLLLGQQD